MKLKLKQKQRMDRASGRAAEGIRALSARQCATSGLKRPSPPRARRRTGALEFGERKPPKFDQQFDPFGESIYNASDYWEASFYSEPDDTPVGVYVESESHLPPTLADCNDRKALSPSYF